MSAQDQSYNGWSTYATWLVNIHFEEIIREIAHEQGFQSAEKIEQIVNDVVSETPPFQDRGEPFNGFLADVMASFFKDVNWFELEDHLNEDEVTK